MSKYNTQNSAKKCVKLWPNQIVFFGRIGCRSIPLARRSRFQRDTGFCRATEQSSAAVFGTMRAMAKNQRETNNTVELSQIQCARSSWPVVFLVHQYRSAESEVSHSIL